MKFVAPIFFFSSSSIPFHCSLNITRRINPLAWTTKCQIFSIEINNERRTSGPQSEKKEGKNLQLTRGKLLNGNEKDRKNNSEKTKMKMKMSLECGFYCRAVNHIIQKAFPFFFSSSVVFGCCCLSIETRQAKSDESDGRLIPCQSNEKTKRRRKMWTEKFIQITETIRSVCLFNGSCVYFFSSRRSPFYIFAVTKSHWKSLDEEKKINRKRHLISSDENGFSFFGWKSNSSRSLFHHWIVQCGCQRQQNKEPKSHRKLLLSRFLSRSRHDGTNVAYPSIISLAKDETKKKTNANAT